MPRFPPSKLPLPVYKPTRSTFVHKLPRDEYLENPAVKYPIYKRLPSFWRKEYETPMPILHQRVEEGTKRPQHSGLWKVGENNRPVRVETVRIPIHYPPETKLGIWSGEGYIYGERFARSGKETAPKYKKIWKPIVLERCYYSEILDRDIKLTVTPLTLDLIDEAYGFDFFILKTCTKRLQEFGGRLKREMLIKLARKETDLYPNDPEKQEKIYNKYKKYSLPLEQAEWVGLTIYEAMKKQWEKEKEQGMHAPVPLLTTYTNELIEQLRHEEVAEEVTVFERT